MRFSLIVTTRGRVAELGLLFESLVAQTFGDFEVIVVDQNADDRLAALADRYAGPLRLRRVRTAAAGASRGRNVGLEMASGDLVGFPDDDCELPATFLARVDGLFRARPDLGAMTGNTHAKGRDRALGPWDAEPVVLDRFNVVDRCVEFSIVIRREVLGGLRFNEDLGVGCGTPWGADEGPDLLIRLMDLGCHALFFPNLIVFHPEKSGVVDRAVLARALSYSRGRGRLFRLHRFPPTVVAKSLLRSLGGAVVYAARADPKRAAYYGLSFAGKLRGVLS